ncbi:MAG: efflux RND transporter permease subunit [Caldilineaceae bacterium]|nr:efflux RND transporter permease subunit [Caldilineaceae bacterium]
MVRWLIQLSTRLHFIVAIIAAVVLVVGITQLRTMPVDVFPEFNPPLVEVQTEALGLSASEVESLITVPMEADLLNGVAWLDQIYSESVAGLASILMVFEPGTDPIRARQMVQERLTQAHALPNVSKPPVMLQPLSSNSRVMMVGLTSDDLSMIELGVLARWNIKPRLMGVPGVANVAVWGHRERQLQVQVDPAELNAQGVSLFDVVETAGEALWVSPLTYLESSKPGTGGWIDTPNQRLGIRHLLPIASPEDLGKVAIVNKPELTLADVSTVVEDHQPLIGEAIVNGAPGLLMVIEKFPSANTLEVTDALESTLNDMRLGLPGVTIDTSVFRPANYIDAMIGNLSTSLLVGLALALIVLFLFLWNWRTAIVALVTIPLSLIAAGLVLYWRGATLNAMTIAGLVMALGVIIDDVVIDVENIARRMREARANGTEASLVNAIRSGSLEMRGSIIYATLILLLIAMPAFFIQGLTGLFFQPLVVSYVVAILTSLVVALLITPGLTLFLMYKGSTSSTDSPLNRAFQGVYGALAGLISGRGAIAALVLAGVLIVVGLAMLPFLSPSFVPNFKQSSLRIQWDAAPGTSHTAMVRTIQQASADLEALSGVSAVSAHVGRAETGDQKVGINSAELWVNLDSSANYDQTVAEIRDVTNSFPGVFRNVGSYMPDRTGQALLGPAADLVVRIYGVDLDVINDTTKKIAETIATVNGVADARPDEQILEPQVEIEVNLDAADQFGLKPGDVRRQATTLLSGLQVGSLFEEQKVFDVVVWSKPELRDNLSDVHNMLIDTPDGGQVRLGEVATVTIVPTPIIIKRDAVSRYMDIAVTLAGRSAEAVTADIKDSLQTVEFPLEYRAEVLGESLAQQTSRQRTLVLLVAALIGIYLLIQAAFGGWRLALAVMLAMVAALSGGLVGAVLTGGLTLGALFGLMAILGIAVRNSLVTLHHTQGLERAGLEFGPDLVTRAAKERAGVILTTALVTAVAILPLILWGNIAGQELLNTLAIVLLCGLVTTTVVNLLVIPALYAQFHPEPDSEDLYLTDQVVMGAAD